MVNNTIWHPAAASAVDATRSLPGAESRFRPCSLMRSPYSMTPNTGLLPDFCVQPRAFSSRVEMPPALLPGDGFSPTGSPCDRKYSLKLLMSETVSPRSLSFAQRSIRMVSAPNISGTSVSTVVPPSTSQSQSENSPSNGLAVMPENPSDPPHFNPIRSLDAGTSVRSHLRAFS